MDRITWKDFYQEAMQRHHDYFVRLAVMEQLSEVDYEQYQLALQREQNGEVNPLIEDGAVVDPPLKINKTR